MQLNNWQWKLWKYGVHKGNEETPGQDNNNKNILNPTRWLGWTKILR
jgi:hypothetical protein